ncbi:hypothetical protein [Fusobacterium polymorphum]|jgi:hypothetical protein|uniref:hypothetical protein n=1 Tax=Fusobacterium nucleatum subsp. polymorphum TaxID=76857 RepID=UPI00291E041A|nr:hypothetical protein FNCP11_16180 [Fusobacterium nucleatum]BEP10702.1 hypothetical protein FNSP11_15460 [Fusobacterium nucleatum]
MDIATKTKLHEIYKLGESNYFIFKKMFGKKEKLIFCEFENQEFSEIFEGYYIMNKNIENRRFFLVKNPHEKKKKIVVFTLEKKLEMIDNFIELDDDFYIFEEGQKTWVIFQNEIIGTFNTMPKSFSKIYLENIFDDITSPEIKAYKCELIETREAHHTFNEDKNIINFTKSLYIIPFFESYICLTAPERENKIEEYHSWNIKKVFVERFNKEKKEIILQIIYEQTFYENKKKYTSYEVERIKGVLDNKEIKFTYSFSVGVEKNQTDECRDLELLYILISKLKIYLKSLSYILEISKFKHFRIFIVTDKDITYK